MADGDSIVLRDGTRVRLLQIDAPELRDECYGEEAAQELARLTGPGQPVTLGVDPALDDADRFGRLLRYVLDDGTNVNVELVRRGAATPFFRRGERGKFAGDLLAAVESARNEARGMWRACRVTWEPDRQVDTRSR